MKQKLFYSPRLIPLRNSVVLYGKKTMKQSYFIIEIRIIQRIRRQYFSIEQIITCSASFFDFLWHQCESFFTERKTNADKLRKQRNSFKKRTSVEEKLHSEIAEHPIARNSKELSSYGAVTHIAKALFPVLNLTLQPGDLITLLFQTISRSFYRNLISSYG